MKRILSVLLGLLIALPVLAVVQQGQQKPRFANTWAAIRDVEPGEHHTEKRDTYTILYQLSSGKPISVFIEFKNPTPDNVRKEYQKAIENSYKEWFKNAEKFIKESGHKKDFSQVLTRLKKPKVKFISSKQEADLVVVVEPLATVQEDCDGRELLLNMVGGCVVLANENKGHMFLPELEDVRSFTLKEKPQLANVKNVERRVLFTAILPHEIGHTLGLADQYEQAIHRTSHRLYRSTHVRDGMMKSWISFMVPSPAVHKGGTAYAKTLRMCMSTGWPREQGPISLPVKILSRGKWGFIKIIKKWGKSILRCGPM